MKSTTFRQQLKNIFQRNSIPKSTFMIVTWFGRSYYKKKSESWQIFKELIIANIDEPSYIPSHWNKSDMQIRGKSTPIPHNRIYIIDIIETEVASLKLGDIYNYEGKRVNKPVKIGKYGCGLYTVDLNISKRYKICYKGLYNFLKKSLYPCHKISKGVDNIYKDAPHYKYIINETHYILPIHVINNFFYYKDSICMQHILYNRIWNLFGNPMSENNEIIIPFVNEKIAFEDLIFFSNFLLIKGNKELQCIRKITSVFLRESLNSSSTMKYYLQGDFPFKENMKIKVIGQYITSENGNVSKFIIYDILKIIDYPKSIHTTSRYFLKNVSANILINKHKLQKHENTPVAQSKNHLYIGSLKPQVMNCNKFNNFNFDFFYNNDKLFGYKQEEYNISETEEIKNITPNQYFKFLRETIIAIGKLQNYYTSIFEIKMYKLIKDTSFPPIILCANIKYKNFNFYLLDYGFKYSIPIFRKKNALNSINRDSIEKLVIDLYHLKLRWKRLKIFELYPLGVFHVVSTINHFNIHSKKNKNRLQESICTIIAQDINNL